jgi:hypothetical protein
MDFLLFFEILCVFAAPRHAVIPLGRGICLFLCFYSFRPTGRVSFFLLAQKERDERKRALRNRLSIFAFMNVLGRSVDGTSVSRQLTLTIPGSSPRFTRGATCSHSPRENIDCTESYPLSWHVSRNLSVSPVLVSS